LKRALPSFRFFETPLVSEPFLSRPLAGIAVTIVGGAIVMVIHADAGFAWQRVGETYTFFLHRVSGTTQYRIFPGDSFKLSPNATVTSDQLSSGSPKITSLGAQANFLTEIADAYKVSKEVR
jgi:hypothetical protein